MTVYKTGTVSVTNGSATVTGSGTAWNANVSAGDIFHLVGGLGYTVDSVVSDTELTLTTTFGGTTGSGLTYSITRDFTTNGKPLLAPGAVSISGVYNANLQLMEDLLADLSGVTDASTARDSLGLGTAAIADATTSDTDQTSGRVYRVDDFPKESGTWTPTIGASSTDPTITYIVQNGYFRRVGDVCHVSCSVDTSAFSGGSGNLLIRGLPFTAANITNLRNIGAISFFRDVTPKNVVVRMIANRDYVDIPNVESDGLVTVSDVTGDPDIHFSLTYFIG